MMIIKAKSAGFCFGVKNAVNMVYAAVDQYKNKNIYTLGQLIHNPTVEQDFERLGVKKLDDISQAEDGVIVIRSHGVGKNVYGAIEKKGLKYIDATCPCLLYTSGPQYMLMIFVAALH